MNYEELVDTTRKFMDYFANLVTPEELDEYMPFSHEAWMDIETRMKYVEDVD